MSCATTPGADPTITHQADLTDKENAMRDDTWG
jgi:hypothetical protein